MTEEFEKVELDFEDTELIHLVRLTYLKDLSAASYAVWDDAIKTKSVTESLGEALINEMIVKAITEFIKEEENGGELGKNVVS